MEFSDVKGRLNSFQTSRPEPVQEYVEQSRLAHAPAQKPDVVERTAGKDSLDNDYEAF